MTSEAIAELVRLDAETRRLRNAHAEILAQHRELEERAFRQLTQTQTLIADAAAFIKMHGIHELLPAANEQIEAARQLVASIRR